MVEKKSSCLVVFAVAEVLCSIDVLRYQLRIIVKILFRSFSNCFVV